MRLLMISGDRSIFQGKKGAFYYTLQELRKHFDSIDVLCPHTAQDVLSSAGEHGAKEYSFCSRDAEGGSVQLHINTRGMFWQPSWILSYGKTLHAMHAFDVLSVHDYPPFYNGIGARLLHAETGIPYASEIHHIVGWPSASSLSEWIGRWMTRFLFGFISAPASAIRVVNASTKDQLIQWGIPSKNIHIVSSMYLDSTVLHKKRPSTPEYDLVFCGRLVPNKGLSNLLEAVSLLPHIRLVVIGDGPERRTMERKASALHIDDRVTFCGWLPTHEDVIHTMQSASIFVMCSKSEGGPRVALEAMACGMPVIVTPVGLMPEIIDDGVNGLITDGSPKDLASHIQRLLSDASLRNSLSTNATAVLKNFERSVLIARYADFLQGLK